MTFHEKLAKLCTYVTLFSLHFLLEIFQVQTDFIYFWTSINKKIFMKKHVKLARVL